jgi:hypothetical protein
MNIIIKNLAQNCLENDTYKLTKVSTIDKTITKVITVLSLAKTSSLDLVKQLQFKINFVEEKTKDINAEKAEIAKITAALENRQVENIPILNTLSETLTTDKYSKELIWDVIQFTSHNHPEILKNIIEQQLEMNNLALYNKTNYRLVKKCKKESLVTQ